MFTVIELKMILRWAEETKGHSLWLSEDETRLLAKVEQLIREQEGR